MVDWLVRHKPDPVEDDFGGVIHHHKFSDTELEIFLDFGIRVNSNFELTNMFNVYSGLKDLCYVFA